MKTHALTKARRKHYRRRARKLGSLAPGQARDCLRASLHDRASRENAGAIARTERRLRQLVAVAEMDPELLGQARLGERLAARVALDLLHGERRVLVVSPSGVPITGHHATGIMVDEVDEVDHG